MIIILLCNLRCAWYDSKGPSFFFPLHFLNVMRYIIIKGLEESHAGRKLEESKNMASCWMNQN